MKAKDVYTEKYINYFKDTLTRLMATPSPSGYFREVNALLTELAQKENARCTVSPKGTCEIFIQGKGKETVGLSAHCDTLGAMVRSVSPSGEIMFATVGGIILPTLDGEYCRVRTRDGKTFTGTFLSRSPAIHVFDDCVTRKRDEKNMYVRLDEKVCCADDVRRLGNKKRRLYFHRHQNGVYRQRVRKIPFSGRQGGSRRAVHRPARVERGKNPSRKAGKNVFHRLRGGGARSKRH